MNSGFLNPPKLEICKVSIIGKRYVGLTLTFNFANKKILTKTKN